MLITLPPNYPYVMLVSIWIAFECYLTGFTITQGKRRKVFNKEFMKKNFEKTH